MKGRLSTGLSLSDRTFIETYYKQFTGKEFKRTSCGDCYKDYFIEMSLKLKSLNFITMEELKWQLKKGAVLTSPGVASVLAGRGELDEKDVLEHLAKFPVKIKFFEKYPANWKSLVEGKEAPEQKGDASTALNATFIAELALKLGNGASKASLENEYKGYLLDGKKVTQKALRAYMEQSEIVLQRLGASIPKTGTDAGNGEETGEETGTGTEE